MRMYVSLLLLMFSAASLHAQSAPRNTLDVYPREAPGARGHRPTDHPTIDVYLPAANPTHSAVLVIPGGSYSGVVDDREGAVPAQWLTQRGVAAFVLHYRV